MIRRIFSRLRMLVWLIVVLLIARFFVEARYIPSMAMLPNLRVNDRMVLQKVSDLLHLPPKRGTIIFFYPPPIEMGGEDLTNDIPHFLGRATGLPIFPYEPAFVKRVIGLPGDQIRIEAGVGVYVNGQLLSEPYVYEPAGYSLNFEADIGGRSSSGAVIHPYPDSKGKIVVPEGKLFVLGDNRNNSEDSHIWGYLNRDRIIGRLWFLFQPKFEWADTPDWKRMADTTTTRSAADGTNADGTTRP